MNKVGHFVEYTLTQKEHLQMQAKFVQYAERRHEVLRLFFRIGLRVALLLKVLDSFE